MKTVTKGNLFTVSVSVDDKILETMKHAPLIVERVMGNVAEYWHTKIMPEHFKKSAHQKYGYAQRSRNYLKSKHGKPDLVNSGSMSRDLKSNAAFKFQTSSIELRMFARVLNLAPNMSQNDQRDRIDHSGRRRKSSYPNTKKEIRAITDDEREAVAQVAVSQLERAFGDSEGRESDD